MEITYIGHSCFKVKTKNLTLVFDPYDPKKTGYALPKLSADIVLVSHDHFDHNFVSGVSDYKLLIDKPGEYETKGVFIYGLESFHDNKQGKERGKNNLFHVEADGLNLLHLGDLGHELSKETLEQIPSVDILFVPVGGTYTIDAEEAAEVISQIEPAVVIPMHYQTSDLTGLSKDLDKLDKFLDEMGVEDEVKKVKELKITKADITEETEVIVITPQH